MSAKNDEEHKTFPLSLPQPKTHRRLQLGLRLRPRLLLRPLQRGRQGRRQHARRDGGRAAARAPQPAARQGAGGGRGRGRHPVRGSYVVGVGGAVVEGAVAAFDGWVVGVVGVGRQRRRRRRRRQHGAGRSPRHQVGRRHGGQQVGRQGLVFLWVWVGGWGAVKTKGAFFSRLAPPPLAAKHTAHPHTHAHRHCGSTARPDPHTGS